MKSHPPSDWNLDAARKATGLSGVKPRTGFHPILIVRYGSLVTGVGVGLLAVALLCYPVTALTVRPARGVCLLWAVPASSGAEFRVTWIHTVSTRPVSEKYAIDAAGRLCLVEMVFDHEGPNLPSGPEEGTTWRIEEGRVVVTGYRRCLDRLNMGVSPLGHRLEKGASDWDLVAGVGPDRLIRVTLERTPLILIVLAEVWQWRHNTCKS